MINFREGWRGHLWQGQFVSFIMEEEIFYLLILSKNIKLKRVKV